MSDLPDWIKPGAEVIVESGRRTGGLTVQIVERCTKTQIVLVGNPTRFRIRDLQSIGERSAWTLPDRLLNPADPDVQRRLREQTARNRRLRAMTRVEPLLLRWRRDDDDDAAREAMVLLKVTLAKIAGRTGQENDQ